jgi:multidrug transporter EmrE-like cation transporter
MKADANPSMQLFQGDFMKLTPSTIIIFLVCVAANVISQFLLKFGTKQHSFVIDITRPWESIVSVFTNPFLLGGIACAIVSMTGWMIVVSRSNLSVVFPIANALAFFCIAFFAQFLFGETMTGIRWAGIALIALGIFLASQ